jgi:hypothetical protein
LINTYDIDGVINLGPDYRGLTPMYGDIIITGRSFEEAKYTNEWLHSVGVYNTVFYSPLKFTEKTREASGKHKGETLKLLLSYGIKVGVHFEDDPVQAEEIRKIVDVPVVLLVHDLVEKENVWHGSPEDRPSTTT